MTDTSTLEWTHDGKTFEGLVAKPEGRPRGAVLVCHAWAGRAAHEEAFARRLAADGYVAMAGDVYGKGVRGGSNEENEALMMPLVKDRPGLEKRLLANLEALAGVEGVDAAAIAAAGFCFGGLCVLDLARANARLLGVAAFHAILGKPDHAGSEPIGPQVLALQGFDDPMAGPDDLVAFGKEMTARQADWQLLTFGGVAHAFTNEDANQPENGLVFKASARDRAYRAFDHFLADLFA